MFAKFNRRHFEIYLTCLAALGVMGWVDYVTGYELGFFVFYSAPVGIAAWYLGRWPGVWMSLVAATTWALADSFAGERYSSWFSLCWNNAIHFASFIINALTIARIKLELDKRYELAAELESVRETLRAVAGQLSACPVCGKSHGVTASPNETGRISEPPPELDAALCSPCRTAKKTSG